MFCCYLEFSLITIRIAKQKNVEIMIEYLTYCTIQLQQNNQGKPGVLVKKISLNKVNNHFCLFLDWHTQ